MRFLCKNAPPGRLGALVFGVATTSTPTVVNAADIFIDLSQFYFYLPVTTNAAGYVSVTQFLGVPKGTSFGAQYVLDHNFGVGWVASQALWITIN